MADVTELILGADVDDELGAHGLFIDDAFSVLDGAEFKTFTDPRHAGRRFIIGPDATGRLLTLVAEPSDNRGTCTLITGWSSSAAETTLFNRPGGTQYAGKPSTDDRRRR